MNGHLDVNFFTLLDVLDNPEERVFGLFHTSQLVALLKEAANDQKLHFNRNSMGIFTRRQLVFLAMPLPHNRKPRSPPCELAQLKCDTVQVTLFTHYYLCIKNGERFLLLLLTHCLALTFQSILRPHVKGIISPFYTRDMVIINELTVTKCPQVKPALVLRSSSAALGLVLSAFL
ncbi:hypothetical protein TNCV_1690131 [Trichonephila clavipes]|nr:hypothetical protein TNCV_1690131 [Trichonephila clavipes]